MRVGDYVTHKGTGTLGQIRQEIPPDKFYTMEHYDRYKFYLVDWQIKDGDLPPLNGGTSSKQGYASIEYYDTDGVHFVYLDTILELAPQYNTKLGSLW